MRLRTINQTLLRQLVRRTRGGRQSIAKSAGCSVHTISNWMRPNYQWGLAEYYAHEVAAFLGVDVNVLFPLAHTEEKAS